MRSVRMARMPPAGSSPLPLPLPLPLPDRVLLHASPLRRIVVVPDDVYLLEADGDDTIVPNRGRRSIRNFRLWLRIPSNQCLP